MRSQLSPTARMLPIFEHAIEVEEALPGENSGQIAQGMSTLADAYAEEGKKDRSKYAKAVPLYERAVNIETKNFGPDHPNLIPLLNSYITAERALGDQAKATELQAWIDSIERKSEAQSHRSVQ